MSLEPDPGRVPHPATHVDGERRPGGGHVPPQPLSLERADHDERQAERRCQRARIRHVQKMGDDHVGGASRLAHAGARTGRHDGDAVEHVGVADRG